MSCMTSRRARQSAIFVGALVLVLGGVYTYTQYQPQEPVVGSVPSEAGDVGTVTTTEPAVPPSTNTPSVEVEEPAKEPQREFQEPSKLVLIDVPFTSQAPFRDWKDPRQQDGCEEASVLMTMKWANGETMTQQEALDEILKLSAFQEETYSEFHDTSAKDTFDWLVADYYEYTNAELRYDIGREDIIQALMDGYPVIVPVDGQKIGNKYYTQPGPERHMLVVIGYDPRKNEFITNDPGIGRGAQFRYPEKRFVSSLRDYSTGYHAPFEAHRSAMIVIKK